MVLSFPSHRSICFTIAGRGLLSRSGKKSSMHDENRRATYNISNQPVSRSESIFTTFDGEIKQLVAVCDIECTLSYWSHMASYSYTFHFFVSGWASCRSLLCQEPGSFYCNTWTCCLEGCLGENCAGTTSRVQIWPWVGWRL